MVKSPPPIFLSICIPTRGRIQILKKTLESIFSSTINLNECEIVIYDSSDDQELEINIHKWYAFPNLVYQKGPNHGYLNLISALKLGTGSFLKLHNDYSEMTEGSLLAIINQIKSVIQSRPTIFFSNGMLKNLDTDVNLDFNDFLYKVSFFSSWSNAFGIWKTDFESLRNGDIEKMFPHCSYLFALNKKKFVINNKPLFFNHEIAGKGGYNLFETFAGVFLGMLKKNLDNGYISEKTFRHIKYDMLRNFFVVWYCNTVILDKGFSYGLENIKKSMLVHYSNLQYNLMLTLAYCKASLHLIRKGFKG